MSKSKDTWRKEMKTKRLSLSQEAVKLAEKTVTHDLMQHPDWEKWQTIGAYHPHQNECSPLGACHKALLLGKKVFLPQVQGDDLIWRKYSLDDPLVANQWGILEPVGGDIITADQLDVLWVPGVAFAKDFVRLGNGKGYFDRLLKVHPHLHTIGLCYDFQWTATLPTDPWDKPMNDLLIVET